MTATVMTVRGPVPADQLGHIQPHEHLFFDISWVPNRWDLPLFEDEEQMTEEVRLYSEAGGQTIVELSCIAIGRNPEALRRVSEATGVQIVMCTGWYRAPYYPPYIETTTTSRLADMLVDEIENGVGEQGIRPGIIGEIGTDKRWMQGVEERVFRAAARAHLRTGLAVTTHTPPRAAHAHLDILFEEGADPTRVIVGHCDDTLEMAHLESILARGAYVEFDLIGIESINTDARRAVVLGELIRRGHAERLLLAQDMCTRPRLKTNGGEGLEHLIMDFLPRLCAEGIDEEVVRLLTHVNPQRVLAT
jgi:predicted metal-dependent phosphotriesterase family hydrolase